MTDDLAIELDAIDACRAALALFRASIRGASPEAFANLLAWCIRVRRLHDELERQVLGTWRIH